MGFVALHSLCFKVESPGGGANLALGASQGLQSGGASPLGSVCQ